MVFAKACAACGGTGRQQRRAAASRAAARGRTVRTEAVAVRLPAGVADGARLRVSEKGHAGADGGRTGDLYVDVHVQAASALPP